MAAFVATIVTFVACVICVIGLAIPFWVSWNITGGRDFHSGLWELCVKDGNCATYTHIPDWMMGVRAMEIMGFLISGAAVLLGLLKAIFMKDKIWLAKSAGVLALTAGALMIIGIAIFAAKKEDNFGSNSDLHAGFALCIISAVVSFVGGVLFIVSRD